MNHYLLYPLQTSLGGYIHVGITLSECLSVRLSVQIRVGAIISLFFEVGIPYLAHECITMSKGKDNEQ